MTEKETTLCRLGLEITIEGWTIRIITVRMIGIDMTIGDTWTWKITITIIRETIEWGSIEGIVTIEEAGGICGT